MKYIFITSLLLFIFQSSLFSFSFIGEAGNSFQHSQSVNEPAISIENNSMDAEALAGEMILMVKRDKGPQICLPEDEKKQLKTALQKIQKQAESDPVFVSLVKELYFLEASLKASKWKGTLENKKRIADTLSKIKVKIDERASPEKQNRHTTEKDNLARLYFQISVIAYFFDSQIAFKTGEKALKYQPDDFYIHIHYGNLHFYANRFEEAESIYQEILKQEEHCPNSFLRAKVYERLGKINVSNQEWESARDYYEKASATYQKEYNEKGIARQYLNLGEIHYINKEWSDAERNYRRAFVLYSEIEDPKGKRGKGEALYRLSKLYDKRGNTWKPSEYIEKSLNNFETIGDPCDIKKAEEWQDRIKLNNG